MSDFGSNIAALSEAASARPCDLLGIEGSPLERLLWDIAIVSEMKVPGMGMSTKDKIRRKRRQLGI